MKVGFVDKRPPTQPLPSGPRPSSARSPCPSSPLDATRLSTRVPLAHRARPPPRPPAPASPPPRARPRQALILVGGFGTRLRPLTLSKPKPLVEFCNKPQLLWQIEALVAAGVTEVILAISYPPSVMEAFLREVQAALGVKVLCSHEPEPLGTAGPIAYARDLLACKEPFFVVNSDVTCAYPFAELLAFHRAHGREGTVLVTKVEEPSKFGVVLMDGPTGRVSRFVNKPKQYAGNLVSAGVMVFNSAVLGRLQPVFCSMEKEVLPVMAQEGELYAMPLIGYWMDIGDPKHHLLGAQHALAHARAAAPASLSTHAAVVGDALVHATARIGAGCVVGPGVVIGPDCVVDDGAPRRRPPVRAPGAARAAVGSSRARRPLTPGPSPGRPGDRRAHRALDAARRLRRGQARVRARLDHRLEGERGPVGSRRGQHRAGRGGDARRRDLRQRRARAAEQGGQGLDRRAQDHHVSAR